MRLILTLLLLASTASLTAADTAATQPQPEKHSPRFGPEKKLHIGIYQGHTILKANKKTVKLGKKFTLDVRFSNTGNCATYYNPFFQGLIPVPAQLAVFDSHHHYLGNLLARESGSWRMLNAGDWTQMGPKSYVGTLMTFVAGSIGWQQHLPPGDYGLQMIYYRGYIAKAPSPTKSANRGYGRLMDYSARHELFRSNVVKITFTQ